MRNNFEIQLAKILGVYIGLIMEEQKDSNNCAKLPERQKNDVCHFQLRDMYDTAESYGVLPVVLERLAKMDLKKFNQEPIQIFPDKSLK